PDPSRGMFSSLQAGMAEAQGDALLVLPADMPFVESGTVAILLDVFASRPAIVSPRYQGKRGHPVVLPPRLRDEIRSADPSLTLPIRVHEPGGSRIALGVFIPVPITLREALGDRTVLDESGRAVPDLGQYRGPGAPGQ